MENDNGNANEQRFRYGVRTLSCERLTTLGDFVASALAQEPAADTSLAPLDLLELGAVYVNDERALNPARRLEPGDRVRLHSSPRRFSPPPDLRERVIAETEDSLLVEKPRGLPAEPTVDNVRENLLSFLEDFRGQSLFLTHRLEPESEGLLLIAKNAEARQRIAHAFATGKIRRRYAVYVEATPPETTNTFFSILGWEVREAKTNLLAEGRQTWAIDDAPLDVVYRLEIEFTAARPREIREEFARLGLPILGDQALGSRVRLIDSATRKSGLAFRALNLAL